METFDTDFEYQMKRGIFVSRKILIVLGVAIAVIFVACICATYFGKHCENCSKNFESRCGDLYCENKSILDGIRFSLSLLDFIYGFIIE